MCPRKKSTALRRRFMLLMLDTSSCSSFPTSLPSIPTDPKPCSVLDEGEVEGDPRTVLPSEKFRLEVESHSVSSASLSVSTVISSGSSMSGSRIGLNSKTQTKRLWCFGFKVGDRFNFVLVHGDGRERLVSAVLLLI